MNIWEKIWRFTWILIAVVVTIGIICVFIPQYSKYKKLQDKREALRKDVADEEETLKYYQLQEQRFPADRDFVEQVARREGMVKTNEALCVLVTSNMPTPRPQAARQPVQSAVRGTNMVAAGRASQNAGSTHQAKHP